MLPSCSVRVTRRVRCSQVTSRPCRSRVLPLLLFDGSRYGVTSPVTSLQHEHPVVGDVGEQQVAPVAEPHRTLQPAAAGPQPLDHFVPYDE